MMPKDTPLVLRFLAKFVLDIMPAALASVIGGFLFSHYHWSYAAVPAPAPVGEQHAAASAEMMKLVRDEHSLIVDFLNAEMKAERSRLAAEEKPAADHAPARAGVTAAVETRSVAAPPHRPVVALIAAAPKPVPLREPATMVSQREFPMAAPPQPPALPAYHVAAVTADQAAGPAIDTTVPRPPLAIGPAQPGVSAGPSLITRAINQTAAIKDSVVGATQHAADVIEGIPSWFGGSAGRGEGPATSSPSAGHLVSANW
jgi:hypothetical protein